MTTIHHREFAASCRSRDAHATRSLRLTSWAELGRSCGLAEFEASFTIDDVTMPPVRTWASGPIAAVTQFLYDAGFGVEIVEFHQRHTADGIATEMYCERAGRRTWSSALDSDGPRSAVLALVDAAETLHRASVRPAVQA